MNFTTDICEWFARYSRKLPWRADRDPYHVWVSEIMLQQTRVEAVKPYYERFIGRLPDVSALAEIPEDELLKLWEGLGYYSRVRNMQKAARIILTEYGGDFPSSRDKLLKLPGIGPYTAGAIASIAFREKVPAVDGNVLRVISRYLASRENTMKQSVRSKIEAYLSGLLADSACDPGLFNQALMEIGACVCLPSGPAECDRCPLQSSCSAYRLDIVSELPVRTPPARRRIEERTILVIRDYARVLLHKRPPRGLLAGLYEFPGLSGHVSEQDALSATEQLGFTPLHIEPLEESRHIFSHIEWQMTGYVIQVADTELPSDTSGAFPANDSFVWTDAASAEKKYAIPAAFKAYSRWLTIRTGKELFEK